MKWENNDNQLVFVEVTILNITHLYDGQVSCVRDGMTFPDNKIAF